MYLSVFLSVRLSVCLSKRLYLSLPKGEGNAAKGGNFASGCWFFYIYKGSPYLKFLLLIWARLRLRLRLNAQGVAKKQQNQLKVYLNKLIFVIKRSKTVIKIVRIRLGWLGASFKCRVGSYLVINIPKDCFITAIRPEIDFVYANVTKLISL